MSDLPDDIKSALSAALAPWTARIEALETKAVTAEHTKTQELVKGVSEVVDSLHSRMTNFETLMSDLEKHITATVEGALHSPLGVAVGAGVAFILGIAALALAQHFGVVG